MTAAAGVLTLLFLLSAAAARAQSLRLEGQVTDTNNAPIAGASCTLTGPALPDEGIAVATDPKGKFSFSSLVPGSYNLTCGAVHYEPVAKTGIAVGLGAASVVQVILPAEVILRQKVEVSSQAGTVAEQDASRPAQLTAKSLLYLPLVQQKFLAALPLVPGVIRTPDGRISIKGSGETQGMLLVNSAESVDPVTGSFSIDVPIDAVESLRVYKSMYNAQYGRFSGGLTTVHTKAPPDHWDYELNDFVPTPRIKSGHLVGIADDEPRLSFGGPLIKDKLNFSQYLVYEYNRAPVRGLAYPHNEIKTEGLTSLTEFQYIVSNRNLVTADVSVFPLRREFADINSLVPQSASSNYGQHGFSAALTDRYLFSSGAILTTLAKETVFSSNARGQGPQDMIITPEGWNGNFFNAWTRSSNQQELLQNIELPTKDAWGKHELKIGGDFVHRSYSGSSDSHPVLLRREDGTLAEQVDFSGPAFLNAEDTEASVFTEDHWAMGDRLAFDLGLRYSGQTIGERAAFAPRLGVVYSPTSSGRTVIRSGFGIFYDRVPLLAGDFTSNPARTVTLYDASGAPLGPPITYRNFYRKFDEEKGLIVPSGHHLASTPFNQTWNVEIDHEFTPSVMARVSYLSSVTSDQFVIDPTILPGNDPVLLLTNTGSSRYREFETTVRIRPYENADLSVSYTHSLARGDLNTLSQIFIPFEQPVIRPNYFGDLSSNVPNRVITWGRFRLPWRLTVSPVMDVHSGFAYSAVDVFQNYVGAPNSLRFPTFFSIDTKFSKDLRFPLIPWVKNHTLRVGFQVFNLTNHLNPRDVYANTASPIYGNFVGFQHRFYDASLDIVY
jgi:Carboxypeptidase regulatory-like domain/TonB dependent receptor-like, beta-barrel